VYVLDTCVFSPYFIRENSQPPLKERIESTPFEDIWITAITHEEAIQGAFKLINKYESLKIESQDKLIWAYDLLGQVVFALTKPQLLSFSDAAFAVYRGIPERVRKGRTRDCRIASIAVSQDYTVVTHNIDDFSEIKSKALPQLKYTRW
jgi:tRNA(fMet)-specific endonuclease VapC